jgi:ABC-type polysaccharide/polyol phosphate export permease
MGPNASVPVLDLQAGPRPLAEWVADVWGHRGVLGILARSDFHVRYKRASFGILWAVALPLLQATILAIVFAKVIRVGNGLHFGAYVLSGVLPWGYFAGVLGVASTAIVEGATLTDKVWFPRAILALVPALSNLPGLGVSMVALVASLPVLGVGLSARLVLLIPACLLLVAFTTALSLAFAALHVYFRDVRYLTQAALVIWFYVTPIAYPRSLLGHRLGLLVDLNPMSGVVALFRAATVGDASLARPVVVALAATLVVTVAAIEGHRRHDRLFVDLL